MSEKAPDTYKGPDKGKGPINRRTFLGGAAAALSVLGSPATANDAEAYKPEEPESAETVDSVESFDLVSLMEVLKDVEPVTDMEGNPVDREEAEGKLQQFNTEVGQIYENMMPKPEENLRHIRQPINKFEILRTAVEEVLDKEGSVVLYNRDADSMYDSVINGRMQCRSGTYLFLQAAAEILPEDQVEKLVIMYVNGHMLPGYRSRQDDPHEEGYSIETFSGLEMTADVTNEIFLEKIRYPDGEIVLSGTRSYPIRIMDAAGDLRETLTGESSPEDTLFLHIPEGGAGGVIEEDRGNKRSISQSGLDRGILIPANAFGISDTAPGDRERPTIKSVEYAGGRETGPGQVFSPDETE